MRSFHRRRPSPSTSASPINASDLNRVRMVRRSWLTPLSIAVRCSIARSMRGFISRKAYAARRTSRAPRGRNSTSRPLPNFRRRRRAQNRLDLVAQEQNRDDQHHRGSDHPDNEDFGVGGVGRAAPRDDPQDGLAHLHAHFDEIGAPDRVDPERQANLAGQARSTARSTSEKNGLGRAAAIAARQDFRIEIAAGPRNPCCCYRDRCLRISL